MNTLTTEHTPDNIIASWLDDHQEELVNTADYIFHHPELAYQETLSSKCLADYLAFHENVEQYASSNTRTSSPVFF